MSVHKSTNMLFLHENKLTTLLNNVNGFTSILEFWKFQKIPIADVEGENWVITTPPRPLKIWPSRFHVSRYPLLQFLDLLLGSLLNINNME